MKHLKTYENQNINGTYSNPPTLKFKVGDYVYVTGYPDLNGVAKIYTVRSFRIKGDWDYMILATMKKTDTVEKCYIDQEDIERLATEDEIDNYQTIVTTNKYNL